MASDYIAPEGDTSLTNDFARVVTGSVLLLEKMGYSVKIEVNPHKLFVGSAESRLAEYEQSGVQVPDDVRQKILETDNIAEVTVWPRDSTDSYTWVSHSLTLALAKAAEELLRLKPMEAVAMLIKESTDGGH